MRSQYNLRLSIICLTPQHFYYGMHIASDNQCADGQAQPYCKNWFDKQRKQEFLWPSGTLYCTKTGCSKENSIKNSQSYKDNGPFKVTRNGSLWVCEILGLLKECEYQFWTWIWKPKIWNPPKTECFQFSVNLFLSNCWFFYLVLYQPQ